MSDLADKRLATKYTFFMKRPTTYTRGDHSLIETASEIYI